MDQTKTGRLIRALRQGQNLTQAELGEKLGVGGKAVSKWECGAGAPDIALLPRLSELLGVDTEALLRGELGENDRSSGNLLFSLEGAEVSCCGRKLPALTPRKAEEAQRLTVTLSDGDWYVTAAHPMTRDHYVSCLLFLTGDTLLLRKLYPQWDLSVRLPYFPQGTLLWYDTREGLLYQEVR